MARFDTLRKAVDTAVSLHMANKAVSVKEESEVPAEDRHALEERRKTLVVEVRAKNERLKILIDHLRDLHRDIVVLLGNYYKPFTTAGRKAGAT